MALASSGGDPTERALARAREHCFVDGVGDAGEALCAANQAFGIAKIHAVQEKLGFPPDATFVGAPDATVTRNEARWKQGFGYGGRIRWTGDFAVLDIKSNACGMIVAAAPGLLKQEDLVRAASAVKNEGLEVDGIAIEFDLDESNHFLDVCETTEANEGAGAPSHFVVMHSSGHESRVRSRWGLGIYYDECEELSQMATVIGTPWGTLSVLTGDNARAFYDVYDKVQRFSLARREALLRAICGDVTVLCNRTHQGLGAMNDAFLGCYPFDADDLAAGQLFPLTLSPDLPVYLVAPRENFDEETLEKTGFGERAERLGVIDRVRKANLLPHGGGYRYAEWTGAVRVLAAEDGTRRFELGRVDGGTDLIETPRKSRHGYRGDEVRRRMVELRLGDPVAKADITYVLKTT